MGSFGSYCRTLAQAGNEMLITCGPSDFSGSRIQPSGKASIPGYTWKIAVVVPAGSGTALQSNHYRHPVIAVGMPNIAGIRTPLVQLCHLGQCHPSGHGFYFFHCPFSQHRHGVARQDGRLECADPHQLLTRQRRGGHERDHQRLGLHLRRERDL